MRTEKLLDAIGEIDDQLIEDAAPKKKSKIVKINWIKYGSIAACLLLFAVLIYGVSTIRMGSMEEAASDAAAPEETIMEDAAVMEEAAAEEEAPAMEDVPASEEAPAPEEPSEGIPTDEFPAEDTSETEVQENIYDIAYGIVVDGNLYFPISFQERKDFHLIDENAAGLTPENTYQITEKDLGEIIGVVTSSAEESNIGLTLYHYAEYPGDNSIGILDRNDTYEFYVLDREYSE